MLTLYGNVDMREIQLSFMVQDRISELNVDEGERVERGQLLGRLDATRFESAAQELMARLEQAQQKIGELEAGSRSQEIQKAKADVAAEKASLVDAEKIYQRSSAIDQPTTCREYRSSTSRTTPPKCTS